MEHIVERLLSNGLLTPMIGFKGAVLRRDRDKGFRVVPKRWVVERTFGWSSAQGFAQSVLRTLPRRGCGAVAARRLMRLRLMRGVVD